MYRFHKFVRLTDKLMVTRAAPLVVIPSFPIKIINTQFRAKSSLIGSRIINSKNDNLFSVKNSFQTNFIKRFYNEDTNAAGVWDPYPG